MKRLFIYLSVLTVAVFISVVSFAKKVPVTDTTPAIVQPEIIAIDTTYHPYQPDMANIESLVRYQDEQRAKRKKAAMIRIGIGVAGFAILAIGLMRRNKK